jgi:hypothetical protein
MFELYSFMILASIALIASTFVSLIEYCNRKPDTQPEPPYTPILFGGYCVVLLVICVAVNA